MGGSKSYRFAGHFLSWEAALREHWDDTGSKCESHTLTEHFVNAVSLALRSNPLGPHYNPVCVRPQLLSHVQPFATPWTVDGSPPGSSVRGILQARSLQWVAISSCRGSNPCLLHWQAASLLLSYLRSPITSPSEAKSHLTTQPGCGRHSGPRALACTLASVHTSLTLRRGLRSPVTCYHHSLFCTQLVNPVTPEGMWICDTWSMKKKMKNSCTQFCLDWVHTFQGKWTPLSCWLWP